MVDAPATAAIVTAQLLAMAAAVVLDLWLTGGFGLVLPVVVSGLVGAMAMMFVGSRRAGWPTRPETWRVAWWSAAAHWAVGAGAYAALYFSDPTGYAFGPAGLLLAAPVLGLLPGGAALVLTMCAGDGVRTALEVTDPTT